MPEVVLLSPHLDDAVINCWHALDSGNATVTTIFSGIPNKHTYRIWDALGGEADGYKMMQRRRAENAEALEFARGASHIDLDFMDNQYRRGQKPSVDDIVADILLRSPKDCSFLAPLAGSRLRRHPDHVLARKAGISLMQKGYEVSFYPDAPYMFLPAKPGEILLRKLSSRASKLIGREAACSVHRLDTRQLKDKRRSLNSYRTQYTLVNLNSAGGLWLASMRAYELTFRPIS